MKKIMTCSIQKVANIVLMFSFLFFLFPLFSNAQYVSDARGVTLTKPVGDKDLNKIMEWIGQETSKQHVVLCWKDTYNRHNYDSQKECEEAENGECEKLLSWWYVKCQDGYKTSTVPFCLAECPTWQQVYHGAPNVKVDFGLLCALNNDVAAQGISDMVFAPIYMTLNIISFGLSNAAKQAAQNAVLEGVKAGNASATKLALSSSKWTKLLEAIETAEEIVTPIIDKKDQFEYLLANVENLATELERWNEHFDSNFAELTSNRIGRIIDNHFPDPDDRKYIKEAYGQYQLTAMLEADQWRIAKSVLTAASIEPIGLIATINAFALPVCNLENNPFPDVTIIPWNERQEIYPEVKFYSQNSMTLAQAKEIAKSNGWKLANESEIRNAWTVGTLDVFAFGMLYNGKFAVPVQSSYSNLNKGHNIGAVGGNQGFFYILPNHLSNSITPLNDGYVRIENSWFDNQYIHNQSGPIEQGVIQSGWLSPQWKIISAEDGWVQFQNRWKPNHYIHNQNGKIEVGPIQDPKWWSSQWKMVPAEDGWVQIQNKWKPDHYIHHQNGELEVGPIRPNWASTLWKVGPGEVLTVTPPVVTTTPTTTTTAQGNLALNKATKQSSDFGTHYSKYAVDGNTKDRHSGAMFTTTQSDANAWWEVDLGANYNINQINVFNVTDQFKSRLQNLNIKVSKTPFTRNEDGQAFATNVFPDPVGNYKGNATGRYVRVYIDRKDYLNICEVQVMGKAATIPSPPTTVKGNLALGKATKQSSTFGNNTANYAVDGNTKDRHSGAMFTTTQSDVNAWWEVDLGANYDINQINIFNVTDHFKSRLQNLNIKVSKTPFTRNEDGQAFATNVFPDPVGNYKGNATGRYVRVYIGRKDYLNICEVQVMGTPATATTTTTTTMTPAAPGYVRIQNVEKEGHYLHNQNGTLEVGRIQADWSSAQWKIITHAGDWVNIQSRSNPELYLNINGDKLEVAKVSPSYASCIWLKISMPAGSKNIRFLSNLHQRKYLLDQNGKIEVVEINPSSQSAIWKVE